MKKREGFVGNSSSSSFIIPKKCKIEAIRYGLDLIEPKDSIKRLKEIKKSIEKNKDNISSFLFDCKWRIEELDESIKKLEIFEKENKDCFLTSAFDRDRAYELGINYTVFEGDL